jgi:hypothetical protein
MLHVLSKGDDVVYSSSGLAVIVPDLAEEAKRRPRRRTHARRTLSQAKRFLEK